MGNSKSKLFTRYNRVSLPIILLLFIVSGILNFYWVNRILVADFDDSLSEQAQKIDAYCRKHGSFPEPGLTDDWMITFQPGKNTEAKASYETTQHYDPEDKETLDYRSLTYGYTLNGRHYTITISRSMEAMQGLSRSIAMITVITLLLVIIVTLILSQLVMKRLWRPFYHTLGQLKEYKLGNDKPTAFTATGTEEFYFMNAQLELMINNAEREYHILKEFTDNASHEIQTPLTIIRSKLDTILQGDNLTDEQGVALNSVYQAVRRLTGLGQSLLLLSKIDNRQYHELQVIDLKEKLNDKLQQLEEFWQEKELNVSANIGDAHITANPDLIDILLNNILSNASRHNFTGGNINIVLNQEQLMVTNTGIKEAIDESRIFTRFYKKEQHSNHNGLGLAIVKQICDQSSIRLSYKYSDGKHLFCFVW